MASEQPHEPFEELIERFFEQGLDDVESYVQKHPAVASELREALLAMRAMERAAAAFSESRELLGGRTEHSDSVARILAGLERAKDEGQRYEVRNEIDRGGQGAVLAVWDEKLRRRLAMKVALTCPDRRPGEKRNSAASLGRFVEEAYVTAQLDHPGIVPVHDLGLDAEHRVYFTMKLVDGRDLRTIFDLARTGREDWTQARALHVLLKVCEAMAYAHSKGVIHRDLKPSNVMVGRFGEVYVMDWGLARVLGRSDCRDIRIRTDSSDELGSAQRESADDVDSPLVTQDGDVVGTPAYMSPEQARGELVAMGPHSDVYAVGAMLYQLLTGQMPYVPSGSRRSHREVLTSVQRGPPESLHALARHSPAELMAICEKAMARDVRSRYRDMGELAEDLRAYLENRVVRAYRTGAIAELGKWIGRNRTLAAAIAAVLLAVIGGMVVSLIFKTRADRRADDVLRLSALQDLEYLTKEAQHLWPASPDQLDAYREWIRKAEGLMAGLPEHEARLSTLRARALPVTDDERSEQRARHPRAAELERETQRRDFLKRLLMARESPPARDPAPEEVGVSASQSSDVATVHKMAWQRVDPKRTNWGDEAKGLALARMALERATDLPLSAGEWGEPWVGFDTPAARRASIRDTLAWALFANARFEEALREERHALEEGGSESDAFAGYLVTLEGAIAEHSGKEGQRRLDELERRVAALEAEVAQRWEWRFADRQTRWWHDQLEELVAGLNAFADPLTALFSAGTSPEHGWGIVRRLEFAATIEERSVTGAEAGAAWLQALESIADPRESAYGGLQLAPQLGLVPLGRDSRSGLWEFAHLQTGEPPERGVDGELRLQETSGLVFVLLPGGTFTMGAQAKDPAGPNYDPAARDDEAPRVVTLPPFFLSKYEMTQTQWQRFTGTNPSVYGPSFSLREWGPDGEWSGLHPVEQLGWEACNVVLGRLGLALPSEEQWEYGARGGTSTAWWTGDDRDSLRGSANLADQAATRGGAPWRDILDWPELDDGYAVHAPVDRLLPNPFGLHHVHGNVWEWCSDIYDARHDSSDPGVERLFVSRGGSFHDAAILARSAFRNGDASGYANGVLGLRPALEIHGNR